MCSLEPLRLTKPGMVLRSTALDQTWNGFALTVTHGDARCERQGTGMSLCLCTCPRQAGGT